MPPRSTPSIRFDEIDDRIQFASEIFGGVAFGDLVTFEDVLEPLGELGHIPLRVPLLFLGRGSELHGETWMVWFMNPDGTMLYLHQLYVSYMRVLSRHESCLG